MTIEAIITFSKNYLTQHQIETAETDSIFLISEILGIRRGELSFRLHENIADSMARKIKKAVLQRGRNVPVAYILGYKDFFMDRFLVNRKTLIPRADTEHLLYTVQESGRNFNRVLDVGTGSGALALSCARILPEAEITAIDVAVSPALKNKKALKINRVQVVKADFFHYKPGQSFDLILSNPPYLSKKDMAMLGKDAALHEPMRAFKGGDDGLIFYHALADFTKNYLEKNGWIVLEVDHKWQQVKQIILDAGLSVLEVRKDYNGLERVIAAVKP